VNAVLSIQQEVLEPVGVGSASDLRRIDPSQIRWLSIKLSTSDPLKDEPLSYTSKAEDGRFDLQQLIDLAQRSQPGGTLVMVWYQGRSEQIVI
jgi:hypothetical protein